MEAVPRLPMLSFELKKSPDRLPVEFSRLKQYIRDFYHEDPETYANEFRALESLRGQAVHPLKTANGCAILKKYFCQLHFLQSRFPMGKDGAAAVQFHWQETYSNTVVSSVDIKSEMVSILYNVAALHTQLGASLDRTTPDGLKFACTHFQLAAWAFQRLKDSFPHWSGSDLTPDLVQFMYQLCLGQAQECILEKSMSDNRKATINAKVAVQIVDYYHMALQPLLQSSSDDGSIMDLVATKVYKSWKKYTKFKATYFGSVSLLYLGMQAEEQQKMGERVSYYQAALEKLGDAMKAAKGVDNPEAISDTLNFTRDVVEGKRKAAKNENEFIYHEEVPDIDNLPIVKGASLVKGIPFSVNDPEVSGPDIFARLVPMKAHEASSLYSEEKAKLLRRICGMVDSKDEEVVSFMSSLQLEHISAHLEKSGLPQEIVDRCAALNAKPDAIPNLMSAMDKLNIAYKEVDTVLNEILTLIKTEEQSEKEYQEVMGTRPPSIVATDLTREANKYMEAHKKAAESNDTLHKAMNQHIENLKVLQRPLSELRDQLPTLSHLKLEDDQSLKDMLMLVGKVDEMRRQRAMLACQLRESICSDDITVQLVTRQTESTSEIFEDEMQKHTRYVTLIEQNLSAQENILPALGEAYANYAPTRKATMEIIRQRDMMLTALATSYDAYEDLIAKSAKGLEFYRKLETNLSKLLQRVKGTCKVQQEERDTILARNGKSSQPDFDQGTPTRMKLKDYLKKDQKLPQATYPSSGYPAPAEANQSWLPGVRPAPVGSEGTAPACSSASTKDYTPQSYNYQAAYSQYYNNYQYPQTSNIQGLQYPNLDGSSQDYNPTQHQYHPISSNHPSAQYTQNYTVYSPGSSNHYPASTSSAPQSENTSPHHTNPQKTDTTSTYSYQQPQMSQGSTPTQPEMPNGTDLPSKTYQNYADYNYKSASPYGTPSKEEAPKDSGSMHNLYNPYNYSYPSSYYYGQTSASSGSLTTYPGAPSSATGQTYPYSQNYATSTPTHGYQAAGQPYAGYQTQQNHTGYPTQAASGSTAQPYPQTQGGSTNYQGTTATPYQGQTAGQQAYQQPSGPTASTAQGYQGAGQVYQNYQQPVADQAATAQAYQAGQTYQQAAGNQTATVQAYQQPVPEQAAAAQAYQAYQQPVADQAATAQAYQAGQTYQQPVADQAATAQTYQQVSGQQAASTAQAYQTPGQVYPEQAAPTSTPQTFQTTQAPSTAGQTYNYQQTQPSAQPTQTGSGQQNSSYPASYQAYGSQYQYPPGQAASSAYTQYYYNHPYGAYGQTTTYPQDHSTYIQSSQNDSTVTYAQQPAISSTSEKKASNVDLLAGLDFAVADAPLQPQQQAKSQDPVGEVTAGVQAVSIKPAEPSTPPKHKPVEVTVEQSPSKVAKDPFSDPEAVTQFAGEVEKFEKFVEGLSVKTLNGPTPLDLKWNELQDLQDKDSHKQIISVARCYPMKNRFADILPFDGSRVELPSTKDDYINASIVKDLGSNCPNFILTQAPLPSTYGDFWVMVLEKQVELIVCLLPDPQMNGEVYWAESKTNDLVLGKIKVVLQSSNTQKGNWIERIMSVTDGKTTRVVVHLQFTAWPQRWFPESPGPFLTLVNETLSVWGQQRGHGSVVVHCDSGVGRTGCFVLVCLAVCDLRVSPHLPDLVARSGDIAAYRKNPLRDRDHLRFAYQCLLYYAQDLLMKRGILASRSSFEEKRTKNKSHTRHPSEDFLLNKDVIPSDERRVSDASTDSAKPEKEEGDPLSQIDPLWPIKRFS